MKKKITRWVKNYGVWMGATTATFGFLHYLLTDGPVYWAWLRILCSLLVQATTAIFVG